METIKKENEKSFDELAEEFTENRNKYLENINYDNPITFIDTSKYSEGNYINFTKNDKLFWNDNQNESVDFGFIGVKTSDTDNFCFVDIKNCPWLSLDETKDAVFNTWHRCFYNKYYNDKISKKKYEKLYSKLNNKADEIEKEIRFYLQK
ncbi:Hypothetical protein KVN_LOCUS16 [uncultured virus]|nr:Hypothetical protein KVN_LOCUS16 [uncultured virus]